jgi:hypothetical protein
MQDIPFTKIEEALAGASYDLAHEPELHQLLLEAQLYVLDGGRSGKLDEPQLVHQTHQGITHLAAYTSLEKFHSVFPGQPHRVLPGGLIFGAIRPEVTLVINLGSWPTRTFSWQQAAELAAQWERLPDKGPVRQPKRYPASLLEALWAHFNQMECVGEAHIAEMHEAGRPPRLVIGLRINHLTLVEHALGEIRDVARYSHDVEVQLHHLAADELSEQLVREGICFFRRRLAASSSLMAPWASASYPVGSVSGV